MASGGIAVEARDVERRYGEGATAVHALRGVSLEVEHGQLVAVMGPSGSGKSTLMHILAGLDTPTSGTVKVAGIDITGLDDAKLTRVRREHIGFVFQFFNLLPMLSAEENVALPLSIAGEKPDRDWFEELLTRTGLADRRHHRPAELSGGQQQRVAIARALVTRPTIVFADEPTGNLDSKTGGEILDLLRSSAEAYNQTIVMVTHEPRAASIADRILFLADGLIVKRAHGHQLIRGPRGDEHPGVVTKVAVAGLLGRKLRAALTAIAIILGVAMVSGTYILTDTIQSAFSTVFTQANKNSDAVVSGKSAIGGNNNGPNSTTPSVPESLLAQIRALPSVAQASGGISDSAQLIGHNGKVISRGGAPGLAFSYTPAGQRFNPLSLTKGTWPSAPDEIAIDASTASKDHFNVGQEIGVVARGPVQKFKIVGTVTFAGVSSLGGATMGIFTLPTAQRLFQKKGKLDSIDVAAKSGTSPSSWSARSSRCCHPAARSRPARIRPSRRPRTPAAS